MTTTFYNGKSNMAKNPYGLDACFGYGEMGYFKREIVLGSHKKLGVSRVIIKDNRIREVIKVVITSKLDRIKSENNISKFSTNSHSYQGQGGCIQLIMHS